MRVRDPSVLPGFRPLLFVACLSPFLWLLWRLWQQDLGSNPVETITRYTGDWTLRFLLITLAVTPLRRWFHWPGLLRQRRMLGLFSFFYACLHFITYLWLDQFFSWADIVADIAKRPYITVGFASFSLLWPLALSSNRAAIRWLGARRWQFLHRLVYLIAMGGVVHFLWLVKSDLAQPLIYASILLILLAHRFRRTAFAQRHLGLLALPVQHGQS